MQTPLKANPSIISHSIQHGYGYKYHCEGLCFTPVVSRFIHAGNVGLALVCSRNCFVDRFCSPISWQKEVVIDGDCFYSFCHCQLGLCNGPYGFVKCARHLTEAVPALLPTLIRKHHCFVLTPALNRQEGGQVNKDVRSRTLGLKAGHRSWQMRPGTGESIGTWAKELQTFKLPAIPGKCMADRGPNLQSRHVKQTWRACMSSLSVGKGTCSTPGASCPWSTSLRQRSWFQVRHWQRGQQVHVIHILKDYSGDQRQLVSWVIVRWSKAKLVSAACQAVDTLRRGQKQIPKWRRQARGK